MAVEVFGVVVADVERRLKPYVFDATSNPTQDDVTELIKEAAADVNGMLSGLGITPSAVTSAAMPVAYEIINRLIADGAAAETYRAMTVRDHDRSKQLDAVYWKRFQAIRANPEMLPEAYSNVTMPGGFRSHLDDTTLDMPLDGAAGSEPIFGVGGSATGGGRTEF